MQVATLGMPDAAMSVSEHDVNGFRLTPDHGVLSW